MRRLTVNPKLCGPGTVFREWGGRGLGREEFAHLGGVSLEVFSSHSKVFEQLADGRVRRITSLVSLAHGWSVVLVVAVVVSQRMRAGERRKNGQRTKARH